jgi:hypothetical protein
MSLDNMTDAELAHYFEQLDNSLERNREQQIRAVNLEIILASLFSQLTPFNVTLSIQGTIFVSLTPEEVDVLLGHYQ